MPAQVVNLTDTFDEWRVKTNTVATLAFTALQDIVDDASPQLGANLDLNNFDITGTGNVNFTGILTATSIAGTVVGTTQSPGNNSTKLATTAYVDAQVATEDTLAEMNDTTMSGLANLDILQYNSSGTTWENKTLSAAGIPTKGFTVAMAVALG
tara:strand:+ start:43 stop:504 length:462 start_codon:yes stop_codon:yes gene_type:complete